MKKNNRNKFGLTERDMTTIQDIFNKYPDVIEVHICGSRAKGNYKPGSDIDLAVMNEGLAPRTIGKLLTDFEESSLPYAIDIVDFTLLNHNEFIKHIDRVGVVLYQKYSVKKQISNIKT